MTQIRRMSVGPRHRPAWRGLTAKEERAIIGRWTARKMALFLHPQEAEYISLVRAVERAVIQKIMDGELRITTPED